MTEDKEQPDTSIEDLTLRETESTDVKGGAVDMFLLRNADLQGDSKWDTQK